MAWLTQAGPRRSRELLLCEAASVYVACPGAGLPAHLLEAAGLPALSQLLADAAASHTLLDAREGSQGGRAPPQATATSGQGTGAEAVPSGGAAYRGDRSYRGHLAGAGHPEDDLAIRATDTLMQRAGKRWRQVTLCKT